jgi:hypothetical protein
MKNRKNLERIIIVITAIVVISMVGSMIAFVIGQ